MSNDTDIPAAPPIMQIGAFIRRLITPNQTINYLIVESIIVGLATATFLTHQFAIHPLVSVSLFIPFVLIILTHFMWVPPEKRKEERSVLLIYWKEGALLLIVGILPLSVLVVLNYTTVAQFCAFLIGAYVGSLYWRSSKYKGERSFYTNEHSEASTEWHQASVALEQAIKHTENENGFRAFYWSKCAENLYESVIEEEKRPTLRNAASNFSIASQFLAVTTFTNGREEYTYHQAAHDAIDAAAEVINIRICDSCGQKSKVQNVTRIQTDSSTAIFCENCKSTYEERRKHTKEERNEGSRERNRRSNQQRHHQRQNQQNTHSNDRMSVEKACDVLGLSESVNEKDEVHSAFRDEVKKAHPDTGGSEDEFKKVKEAREVLIQHLS